MIGLFGGAVVLADGQGVRMPSTPVWVYAIIIGVVLALALTITIGNSFSRGFGSGAITAMWVLMAMACYLSCGVASEITATVNTSRIAGAYGVSDLGLVDDGSYIGLERTILKASGTSDEGPTASVSSIRIPSSVPTSDAVPVEGPNTLATAPQASGAPAAHYVSFKDARGARRFGYIVAKGDYARLYVPDGNVSKSKAKTIAVSEYTGTSTKGASTAAAYDYGHGD